MHKKGLTNLFCSYTLKTVKQQKVLLLQTPFIQNNFKEVFALSVQEIETLFNNIRKILAMLDKIYHAVEVNEKPKE